MKIDAQKIYPNYNKESFYGPGDYQPIINAIGKVIIQVDDEGYQGDTRVLFKSNRDDSFGLLIFGWGSCSGCDGLRACSTPKELQEFVDEIVKDVKWFSSKAEMLKYLTEKDWKLDYAWHSDETKRFIAACKAYLEN